MTDQFLESLLSYREKLVDQTFVDNVFKKINRMHRIRSFIISLCAIVGVLSLSMVNSLDWLVFPSFGESLSFIQLTDISVSSESFTVLTLLTFVFITSWLILAD